MNAKLSVAVAADMENQAIGPVAIAQSYERIRTQNVNGGAVMASEGELGDRRPRRDLQIPDVMDKAVG